MSVSAAKKFWQALEKERPLQVVGTINAYSALLAQRAGFRSIYLSGAGVANASFGLPDLAMTTLSDVCDDIRRITYVCDLPLLVDADTGWGSAFMIGRTVREMIRAGAAACHIEDQVSVKRCGHRPGKALVEAAEMADRIKAAVEMMRHAKKPLLYSGGGIINSGPEASQLLRELVKITGFPITSTLMGLGAFPASDKHWLGMLGMHGTWEANWAMHDCDLMICIGARFDDRITGRLDAFAPHSRKIHVDIDPSSINKNVKVDLPIIGDCAHVIEDMVRLWRAGSVTPDKKALADWWKQIDKWRARKSLAYKNSKDIIKPQYAIQRLYELTKGRDVYITTEVGQHQMWAAQFFHFEDPNRWMTSGGLGTMGYGLPSAVGVQLAHPDALVIDIAGEASVQMTMQEMSTAVQYRLPIKIFIINNQYMGMVRQWQELLHGGRYAESYSHSLPDFVKLAEAYQAVGIRCEKPGELDAAIKEMINVKKPVIFDCVVDPNENCFPMIPSGRAHNEMLLGDAAESIDEAVTEEGKVMV